jgi:hypothetical protein
VEGEFASRIYRWSKKEARREANAGFPIVRAVPCLTAYLFLKLTRNTGREKRLRLMLARVKQMNARFVPRAKDDSTAWDERAVQSYAVLSQSELSALGSGGFRLPQAQRPEHGLSRYDVARYSLTRFSSEPHRTKATIDRHSLRCEIVQSLSPIVGMTGKGRTLVWTHELRIGRWIVATSIDLGGRYSHIRYMHTLYAAGDMRALRHGFDYLQLIGVGQASFLLRDDSEIGESVRVLVTMCERFIDAAVRILRGLAPPPIAAETKRAHRSRRPGLGM